MTTAASAAEKTAPRTRSKRPAFKPGDVVRIKGGGPNLTISHKYRPPAPVPDVTDYNQYPKGWVCLWHLQGALKSEVIDPIALELVPPKAPKDG